MYGSVFKDRGAFARAALFRGGGELILRSSLRQLLFFVSVDFSFGDHPSTDSAWASPLRLRRRGSGLLLSSLSQSTSFFDPRRFLFGGRSTDSALALSGRCFVVGERRFTLFALLVNSFFSGTAFPSRRFAVRRAVREGGIYSDCPNDQEKKSQAFLFFGAPVICRDFATRSRRRPTSSRAARGRG